MKFITSLILLSYTFGLNAQNLDSVKINLHNIYEQNLELRQNAMPIVKKYGFKSQQMDSLNREILRYDSMALNTVAKIIDSYGWLGKSQIGDIPNQALYLTIQHGSTDILVKYFPLLEQSAKAGESNLTDMATMKDRILIANGKKQLYGTQSRMINNKLELFPIEDEQNINDRRKSVGLKELK